MHMYIQLPCGLTPSPCQGMNGIKHTEDGIKMFLGVRKTSALMVVPTQESLEQNQISCALLNFENDKFSQV